MSWAARNGRTVGSLVQPSSMVTNTTGSEVATLLTTGGRPAPPTSGGSGAGSPPWPVAPVVPECAAGAAEGASPAVWPLAPSAVRAARRGPPPQPAVTRRMSAHKAAAARRPRRSPAHPRPGAERRGPSREGREPNTISHYPLVGDRTMEDELENELRATEQAGLQPAQAFAAPVPRPQQVL